MNIKNNIFIKKQKKGFVLVLTLLVTVIVAALLIGFLNVSSVDLTLVKNHICSLKAYYAAEAGVSDAINRIRLNGQLSDIQWQASFPPASSDQYTVTVSQNSTVIKSTGMVPASNFSKTLEVKISISGSSQPYIVSINEWKEAAQ